MPVPPAQIITHGLGTSPQPANLALKGQSIPLRHISGDMVKNPVTLTRILQNLASDAQSTTTTALSNPLASAMIISGISFTNGTMNISHMLGRPYLGWFACRIQNGAWLGYENPPSVSGLDPSLQLQIVSISAATVDLCVF